MTLLNHRLPALRHLGRHRASSWAAGLPLVMGALACHADQPLPALWAAPAVKLDLTRVKPPYAVVARPAGGQRFSGVEIVTLDPRTMAPLTRSPTALSCARVHVSLKGDLLCFSNAVPGKPGEFVRPTSYLHAPDLTPRSARHSPSDGRPSRARLAPDARFFATTEFITGHSYLGTGGTTFSTGTHIGRSGAGSPPENIQSWPVYHRREKVTSIDLNLWGVTFHPADTNRFFVTAYFDGKPYLAEGNVDERRITVLREGLECPSMSPDGRRLAFKKRTSSTGWSPAVLDLATLKETVFTVDDSVDDQIEWIDDRTLVYEVVERPLFGSPTSHLMALDITATRPAQRLWLSNARSPAFVRRR